MTKLLDNVSDIDSLIKIMNSGEEMIRVSRWETTHDKYDHLDSWYELFAGRISEVLNYEN